MNREIKYWRNLHSEINELQFYQEENYFIIEIKITNDEDIEVNNSFRLEKLELQQFIKDLISIERKIKLKEVSNG